MQKRGFPAAGILALMVSIIILLIIVMKIVRHRCDMLTKRKSQHSRRSITIITTYRSRPSSPATAVSCPSTPLILPAELRKDTVTVNAIG